MLVYLLNQIAMTIFFYQYQIASAEKFIHTIRLNAIQIIKYSTIRTFGMVKRIITTRWRN